MREILFRGKRVDNGEWIYGDLVHWWGKHNTKPDIQIYNNVQRFNVIPETVGQYTGLRDCKRTEEYPEGQKIFEGDILEFFDRLVVVFWHTHLGCWDSNFLKFTNKGNGRDDMSPLNWDNKSKVIGNIHDNPELIGGGENA